MNLTALLRRARPARDVRQATKTRLRLECLEDRHLLTGSFTSFEFGFGTDRPVQADYDGDGRTDIAVFRPSDRYWYIQQSRDGFRTFQFGLDTDKLVQADYDGDGKRLSGNHESS